MASSRVGSVARRGAAAALLGTDSTECGGAADGGGGRGEGAMRLSGLKIGRILLLKASIFYLPTATRDATRALLSGCVYRVDKNYN